MPADHANTKHGRRLLWWLCTCGKRYSSGHLLAATMHPVDLARLRGNR